MSFISSQTLLFLSASLTLAGPLDNWHPRATGASNVITALNYGGGRFVAVDEIPGGDSTSYLLISTNGWDWSRQSAQTNLQARGLAVGSSALLTATFYSDEEGDLYAYALRSTNGINWSERFSGALFADSADGIFVAMGYNADYIPPSPTSPLLWTSTNGLNWQAATLTPSSAGIFARGALASGNGISLLLAKLGPDPSSGSPWITRIGVWESTNGVTWTLNAGLRSYYSNPSDGFTLSPPIGIAYGNGVFVAVVDTAAIFTSVDGVTWTNFPSPTNAVLTDVAYGDSNFVAVGNGGAIVSSSDGANWTLHDSGTNSNLLGVVFGQHSFVARSGGGVLQSDPFIQVGLGSGLPAQLTISGPTGTVYSVEYVTDLNPTNSWQVLTNIFLQSDPFNWTDAGSPTDAARFYRAAMLLP